jgi:NAD(P)-dependent dehydrogenase (short-subunit alcohol dehydrogenase family)
VGIGADGHETDSAEEEHMPDRGFAVVTGASSGIGLELARQFVDHDYEGLICAEGDELAAARTDLAATNGSADRPSPGRPGAR